MAILDPKSPSTSSATIDTHGYSPESSSTAYTSSCDGQVQLDETFEASPEILPMSVPVYQSHGKWGWMNGQCIINSYSLSTLSIEDGYTLTLRTGQCQDRVIEYISKAATCQFARFWDGFLPELALYKGLLRPLQGIVVPTVLGVYCYLGRMSIAMEPPHQTFWVMASPDMPDCLKRRCIQALSKIHKCGVYHGDLKLSNILIGADARVTIINFEKSRALVPNHSVGLSACSSAELRMEMKKLRLLLGVEDAQKRGQPEYTQSVTGNLRDVRQVEETVGSEEVGNPELWADSVDEITYRQFVMPNQTPEAIAKAIEQLSSLVDEESLWDPDLSSSPATIATADQSSEQPVGTCTTHDTTATIPRRSSLRKRKFTLEQGSSDRPVKKLRFSGVPDEEPSPSINSVYGNTFQRDLSPISSEDEDDLPHSTAERIAESNIRRCAKLGLPHPEALKRYPKSRRWRHPAILEYMKRHQSNVALAAAFLEKTTSGKGSRRPPQLKRSQGAIQRAIWDIIISSGMMDEDTACVETTLPEEESLNTGGSTAKKRKLKRTLSRFILQPVPQEPVQSSGKEVTIKESISRILFPTRWASAPVSTPNRLTGRTACGEDGLTISSEPFRDGNRQAATANDTEAAISTLGTNLCTTIWPTYSKMMSQWMHSLLNMLSP